MAYRVAASVGPVDHGDLRRLVWRQRLGRGLAWMVIGAILVALVLGSVWFGAQHGLVVLLLALLNLFVLGGIGWGYLAWWISNFASGQMMTPAETWSIELFGDEVRLSAGELDGRFELQEVRRAVWVADAVWERLKGMEDTLVVHTVLGVLRIPECTSGLVALREALQARGVMTTRWIGD